MHMACLHHALKGVVGERLSGLATRIIVFISGERCGLVEWHMHGTQLSRLFGQII